MQAFNLHHEEPTKRRSRYYSSMTSQQFEDYFGQPPKAPVPRPVEEVDDIPPMNLEEDTEPSNPSAPKIASSRIIYKIQPIPEIEGSDNNSINFQYTQERFQFPKMRSISRLDADLDGEMETKAIKRQRHRPRSYSQNSLFVPTARLKIIDFLNLRGNTLPNKANNDQEDHSFLAEHQSGKKRVKKE